MQKKRNGVFAFTLAAVLTACAEAPGPTEPIVTSSSQILDQKKVKGTGLVLESVTGATVPLLEVDLGSVTISQAVITELVLVEDLVGNIIGLEAEGVLSLTGGVLGDEVITEDFSTGVGIASSGSGKCDVLTVDLAPMEVDVLGRTAFVDVPTAEVNSRASGAAGSLLCNLGRLLQGPLGAATSGVRGLVNAINRILI